MASDASRPKADKLSAFCRTALGVMKLCRKPVNHHKATQPPKEKMTPETQRHKEDARLREYRRVLSSLCLRALVVGKSSLWLRDIVVN